MYEPLARYSASKNREGEKYQPGFISQRPSVTQACRNGGEGLLTHFNAIAGHRELTCGDISIAAILLELN